MCVPSAQKGFVMSSSNHARIASSAFGLAAIASLLMSSGIAHSQPSPGYYDSADTTNGSTLRATVHDIIDDHTRFPYTSSATDTWNILEHADEDPNSTSRILDVYKNASYAKQGGGNSYYDREHVWPKSYGFPNDGSSNYAYTDAHHLHLSHSPYNSARGNRVFDNCSGSCSEYATDANDGMGGGSGVYPGNSNWGSGSGSTGSWEVWHGRRGDIARTMFYMDLRYEGGTHGITGVSEPDLRLTDSRSQIQSVSSNQSVAYMGLLSVLLQWHLDDPVDDFERRRNDEVEIYQGNRNPFIDNPDWVACIYNDVCDGSGGGSGGGGDPDPDPEPDPEPTAGSVFINELHYDDSGKDQGEFVEVAGPAGTDLSGWTLVGYNGGDGAAYKTIDLSGTLGDQGGCMGTADFGFKDLQNGGADGIALVDASGAVVEFISYEGSLTASDGPAAGMTSTDIGVSESSSTPRGDSLQRTGTGNTPGEFSWVGPDTDSPGAANTGQTFSDACGGGGGGGGNGSATPWINEFHYDNDGSDTGEMVEVAGPAGFDLSGWELVGYNGNGGTAYQSVSLTGSIPSQQSNYGTSSFGFTGLQNGSADGIALVDPQGNVVQFLSYEGSLTATDGPAAGQTSTDVGVSEGSSTAAGHSLQLTGTGCFPDDFTWASPSADSPDQVNSGQTLSCQ